MQFLQAVIQDIALKWRGSSENSDYRDPDATSQELSHGPLLTPTKKIITIETSA